MVFFFFSGEIYLIQWELWERAEELRRAEGEGQKGL